MAAAGLPFAQASFLEVDMNTREGIDYYHVEFTAEGETYQYDVDALTGSVIGTQGSLVSTPAAAIENTLSENQTKQTPAEIFVTDGDSHSPEGNQSPTPSSQEVQGSANDKKKLLSVEEAKAIALAHAGLKSNQVTFVKSGLDPGDGRKTYDLEFYTGEHREFDYDIDAHSGKVLSFDHDAEYYTPPTSGSNSSSKALTAEEAKAKALAQVPGATADNIREFEADYDDGRLEYEGKIYYDHMEYEFEIDGYSGAIRSWEVESIYN